MKNFEETPKLFQALVEDQLIELTDLVPAEDGFVAVFRSLSTILGKKGITDVPDSAGKRYACDRFFDDWFLYAIPSVQGEVYSLFKLREQEHDAADGAPADGDTPGVTVCFIAFSMECLLDCLADPSEENRKKLNDEIDRTVAARGQKHHPALKYYFMDPKALGPYVIAELYAQQISTFAENGILPVPQSYAQIRQQSLSYRKQSKLHRLPSAIDRLNAEAGRTLCDHEKLYLKNPGHPDEFEKRAILITHTGNTSVYSFAAEVEYHARFLTPLAKLRLPFFGKSVYASAIRADMTVDDKEFEGPAPFYRDESKIVTRQIRLHKPDLAPSTEEDEA